MKKIIYSTLSIALLAVSISSCAKSSKGKMSNEWKVTEYNSKETDTQSNGDVTVTTLVMTETTVTQTTEDTPNGGSTTTTTQTGTVNTNEMTIEKDGTWTGTRDVTYVNGLVTTKLTMATSGTWSFVGTTKGDDFKKNERVLFNTLSETNTQAVTISGSTSTSASTDTYMTGEVVMVYTVKESKKDELQLEAEMGNTYTSGSNTSSTKGTTTITLGAK